MRFLLDKEIVKNLELIQEEKTRIYQDLNVPLVDLIDEPDEFHGYNFKPLYYEVFGDEYIRALLELVGENFEGFEYHYMWLWNLNKYSLPILKSKLRGSLSELHFSDNGEFCLIVSTIGIYFGSRELLNYLDNTDHFDIFYSMTPCENEAIAYVLEVALIQVAYVIIDLIDSTDFDEKNAAKRLHQKLMNFLKDLFMVEERNDNVEVIYFVLKYFDKRNQLFLLSQTIKSIPQKILDVFLNNPKMIMLNDIIERVFKINSN